MLRKIIAPLLVSSAVAVGIIVSAPCAGLSVYAQPAGGGLKDVYAKHFMIGTAWQWRVSGLSNTTYRSTLLREFNSVTHEDDLKPYATMVRAGSANNNIQVTLNSGARQVMQFCVDNNVGLRGHAFVWHQQTPNWFFYADMQNGSQNSPATAAVMNQRMESYIKNLLELIKREFPTLNLYAYDVVNEIFLDNGNARAGGGIGSATANNGTDQSPWVQIYGDNRFADSAFVYARKHAATTFPNMKLFYNDFNEYAAGKRQSMVTMANRLGPSGRGVMDGIGMQSHLSITYPGPTNEYRAALTAFRGTGMEIHVTELDITLYCHSSQTSWCNVDYAPNPLPAPTRAQLATQGGRYAAIFRELLSAKNAGANITSVSVWGVTDDRSWREWGSPLLFNSSFAKKPAYDSLVAVVPQSDWGDGSGGIVVPPPVIEPDANGFYFRHTFEDGAAQGWAGRGDATVAVTNTHGAAGSTRSLAVSGRTDNWNGAALQLDGRAFVPGSSYSFSVMAMYEDGRLTQDVRTDTIQLTMQYELNGTTHYSQVAAEQVMVTSWVQLANTNFAIPAGATGVLLYVEMPNSLHNFYIDNAAGAVGGTRIGPDGTLNNTTNIYSVKNTARGHTPLMTLKGRTLNINAADGSNVNVRVVNLTGKTVASFKAQGSSALSLRKLPAGAYIVEAKANGRKTTQSVVLR